MMLEDSPKNKATFSVNAAGNLRLSPLALFAARLKLLVSISERNHDEGQTVNENVWQPITLSLFTLNIPQ